jgi:hypothetical protein
MISGASHPFAVTGDSVSSDLLFRARCNRVTFRTIESDLSAFGRSLTGQGKQTRYVSRHLENRDSTIPRTGRRTPRCIVTSTKIKRKETSSMVTWRLKQARTFPRNSD